MRIHVEITADAAVRAQRLHDRPAFGTSRGWRRDSTSCQVGVTDFMLLVRFLHLSVRTVVVSLDPIEKNLVEPIDLVFTPDQQPGLGDIEDEASFSLSDAEPPEPLVGGAVDLGAIATEYFLLGIDPYPRKEGATFEAPAPGDVVANPFAALAALEEVAERKTGVTDCVEASKRYCPRPASAPPTSSHVPRSDDSRPRLRSAHARQSPHCARRHGRRPWTGSRCARCLFGTRTAPRYRIHLLRGFGPDRGSAGCGTRIEGRVLVVHTDVAIKMDDKPSQALRQGRLKSSMWQAIDAVKQGEADVAVSGRQYRGD